MTSDFQENMLGGYGNRIWYQVLFVGDMKSDEQAAVAVGVNYLDVKDWLKS